MYKQTMRVIVYNREMELYTIGKVAEHLSKSVETLRAWERQGVIPKPMFKTGKVRLYHPDEVKAMKKVLKRHAKGAKKKDIKPDMWKALQAVRKEIKENATGRSEEQNQS